MSRAEKHAAEVAETVALFKRATAAGLSVMDIFALLAMGEEKNRGAMQDAVETAFTREEIQAVAIAALEAMKAELLEKP